MNNNVLIISLFMKIDVFFELFDAVMKTKKEKNLFFKILFMHKFSLWIKLINT